MSFIDEDLEISVQLDTSLNTVDLNSPLSNEFNLELFNSQHPIEEINLSSEDDKFVTPSLWRSTLQLTNFSKLCFRTVKI